jgi:putative polyhydroxyalkanoate system protein
MKLTKTHSVGVADAKERVERVVANLGARYGLAGRWEGDCMTVTGRSVNGRIMVNTHSVEVTVQVGLSLMMLEKTIRSELQGLLDEELQ